MRKTLLLFASVALLLVSCQKENFVGNLDGEMTKATFTACVDGGVATRASDDNDGNGTNVNRCIMEIYFQDQFYTRLVQPVTPASGGTKAFATFSNVPVVAGKQYQILFWADCVDDAATAEGLEADKYYTTTSLKSVTVAKTAFIGALVAGDNDKLDAFFFANNYTVPQNQAQPFAVTLKRPFAQLNVITTDINKTVTSAALLPDKVSVSYKADNILNVATGETSRSATEADYTFTYEAPVYGVWSDTKSELTLSMDYILAPATEQGAVDVTFKTFNNGDANPVMTHNLTNLPYKRNYRTNVKGDLLTTGGTWKATIEPKWGNGTDSGEIDHIIAATYTEADLALKNAQANGQDKLKIELTQKAVDQMTADETGRYKRTDVEGVGTALQFILYKTGPVDLVEFELPVLPTGINAWIIEYEADYPTQEVAVNTAEDESKVIIKAPHSTVTLNKHEYSYVSSMTAENTLIVPEDVTINELKVVQGNVLVYGVVKSGAVTYADGCTLFHGIRSDISVDNLNNSIAGTAGEWKSNIVKIAHDGKVTDGKTFTVPSGKDVIIEGEATLAGQLKIANSAKVTVKSGTFADVLTFTGTDIAVEGGRFKDIAAPAEATGFITGGLFQIEPKAEYVNPLYAAVANEDPETKTIWPYTIGESTYVVRVNDTYYETWKEAAQAATNAYGSPVENSEIEVIRNCTASDEILKSSGSIKLIVNPGVTLTSTIGNALISTNPGNTGVEIVGGGNIDCSNGTLVDAGHGGVILDNVYVKAQNLVRNNVPVLTVKSGKYEKIGNYAFINSGCDVTILDAAIFNYDISSYAKAGKTCEEISNMPGWYHMTDLTEDNAAFKVTNSDGVSYFGSTADYCKFDSTVEGWIKSIQTDGDEITLLKNIQGYFILSKNNVTLNLNGKTLTGSSSFNSYKDGAVCCFYGDNQTVKNGKIDLSSCSNAADAINVGLNCRIGSSFHGMTPAKKVSVIDIETVVTHSGNCYSVEYYRHDASYVSQIDLSGVKFSSYNGKNILPMTKDTSKFVINIENGCQFYLTKIYDSWLKKYIMNEENVKMYLSTNQKFGGSGDNTWREVVAK